MDNIDTVLERIRKHRSQIHELNSRAGHMRATMMYSRTEINIVEATINKHRRLIDKDMNSLVQRGLSYEQILAATH